MRQLQARKKSCMTIRLIAIAMILVGVGIRIWCFRELTKVGINTWLELAIAAKPTRYTTAGLYSWPWARPMLLRHPMYAGSLMIVAGVGVLGFGEWAGATIVFAAYPHYVRRIVLEEVLRAQTETGDMK